MFDLRSVRSELQLRAAALQYRGNGVNEWDRGFEIGADQVLSAVTGPFRISGSQGLLFRRLDSESFSLGLLHQGGRTGLVLGPLEPEIGVAVTVLNVDMFDGDLGVGMFSPRAVAALGLRLGPVRLDAHAYTEYLWRWFDATDYYVRGLGIALRLQTQAPSPVKP